MCEPVPLEKATEKRFYMVWAAGRDAPVVKHETVAEAKHEAELRSKKHPGEKFYVLQARGYATCVETPATYRMLEKRCS